MYRVRWLQGLQSCYPPLTCPSPVGIISHPKVRDMDPQKSMARHVCRPLTERQKHRGNAAFRNMLPRTHARFVCQAIVFERNSSATRRRNFLETRNSSAVWAHCHTELCRNLEESDNAHGRQGLPGPSTSRNSSAVCPIFCGTFCTLAHDQQSGMCKKPCVFIGKVAEEFPT